MSVWPRYIDRSGQDGNKKSPSTVIWKRAKPGKRKSKASSKAISAAKAGLDEEKFLAGLTKMMGATKAAAYIRKRREAKDKLLGARTGGKP